jgi:hypothetical protein
MFDVTILTKYVVVVYGRRRYGHSSYCLYSYAVIITFLCPRAPTPLKLLIRMRTTVDYFMYVCVLVICPNRDLLTPYCTLFVRISPQ